LGDKNKRKKLNPNHFGPLGPIPKPPATSTPLSLPRGATDLRLLPPVVASAHQRTVRADRPRAPVRNSGHARPRPVPLHLPEPETTISSLFSSPHSLPPSSSSLPACTLLTGLQLAEPRHRPWNSSDRPRPRRSLVGPSARIVRRHRPRPSLLCPSSSSPCPPRKTI
jgi:hypothetical protein